jgi:hypothetical protein
MTKVKKAPIDPNRIRSIPSEGFSWIDRRFVREGFIEPLQREAVSLYLFLTAVSDAHGISFYADPTLGKLLKLTAQELTQARDQLIDQQLMLYRYPLYQVLPLPKEVKQSPRVSSTPTPPLRNETPPQNEDLMSLREYFQLIGRETPNEGEPCHGQKETPAANEPCL